MKFKVLRNTIYKGRVLKEGEVVELPFSDAKLLISLKKIKEVKSAKRNKRAN